MLTQRLAATTVLRMEVRECSSRCTARAARRRRAILRLRSSQPSATCSRSAWPMTYVGAALSLSLSQRAHVRVRCRAGQPMSHSTRRTTGRSLRHTFGTSAAKPAPSSLRVSLTRSPSIVRAVDHALLLLSSSRHPHLPSLSLLRSLRARYSSLRCAIGSVYAVLLLVTSIHRRRRLQQSPQ